MRRALLSIALVALAAGALAAPASADFGLSQAQVTFLEQDGSPATQAGSHPFAVDTTLAFNTIPEPVLGLEVPDGTVKDLRISFPPGFTGNPTAVPYCDNADFIAETCPLSTQVGVVDVEAGGKEKTHSGVFNLKPPPGAAAKIGFKALTVPITVELRVNPNPPFNLIGEVSNIPEVIPFYGSTLRIWGTPASPVHDSERIDCGSACSVGVAERPFVVMPRSCPPTLATVFEVDSWAAPGAWVSKTAESEGTSGCGKLGFGPRISAQPTTSQAESSSGLDFAISVNDEGLSNPKGLAQSDIRKAVVTLPPGVTANPAVAGGLATCSPGQFQATGIEIGPGGCPQASKVGDIEVETPLLEGVLLRGEVYIATQEENPFGTLLALYMVIREPQRGILVKLPGKVEPDPKTGQLITTFGEAPYEVPQVPFSEFRFHFREGARAPLVTPPLCGAYETEAKFYSWANPGAPYTATASFTVGSGPGGGACPTAGVAPFAPGFKAGSLENAGGHYAPFYMRLTREDGEQDLTKFAAVLPPGVTGKIAGIARCSDAAIATARTRTGRQEQAAPSCPSASLVGSVSGGAGVGPELTYVPGSLYLAGPYNGAPLSVVAIVPALAGPFDAGTVVTRVALNLNPSTAQVEVDGAASDPIPHILRGIPLKVRDIRVVTDRPEFTINPTNCEPLATQATIFGSFLDVFSPADDIGVARSARYQAADCASLAFKPTLKLQLNGKTNRGANAALRAEFKSRSGDANLKGAVVTLPPSQFIDNSHINNPCTRAQFAANACPKSSILGSARAFTPLLEQPLEGKVYFLSNGGARDLPDVVAALKGQFDFNLVIAIISNDSGRVRTKVLNAPDAPVSKFVLNMAGGKKGLLENSDGLCRIPQRANLSLTAQNGRLLQSRPEVKTSCKQQGKAKRTALR